MNMNREERRQKAVIAGVDTGSYDLFASLDELAELADTAGADVIGRFTQNRDGIDNATYIGGGKLQEIKEFIVKSGADLLIFDDELTGSQFRNIEEIVDVRVIDRTTLILDIFAQRAKSSEGKLQVELAQQKYRLPRLIGLGKSLSRLGGGIGTRGPGETKLESDRRHIRRRINALEQELETLGKRRARVRERRSKLSVPTIAIVGYTNVGKSTLLNLLTDAGVYTQNQLFATLDPTAREIVLPDGQHAVIIDTVGLIQRLPHQLVEAFKSTLEEAASADVILNVCDAADPMAKQQIEVTKTLLGELGCGDTPVITVYNKADLLDDVPEPLKESRAVYISAKENKGVDRLMEAIADALSGSMKEVWLLIPYDQGSLLNHIRQQGKVYAESFEEAGVSIHALVERKILKSLLPYCCDGREKEE
ncbi:GTPase HflX [Fumia xinanensis]|uniref:GTPase HflX n=1 Tax=Fumia xinanensis TaxID=2763659 RepID=A0A926E0P6_9FIRM|nr:GTPase HflX [Fumia xinanensis]MBC8559444.1 GTPase HflX [Fumia xinanensis]